MRYYDKLTTPETGKTFLEDGPNRIEQTHASVESWFLPLPDGFQRAYDAEGLPYNAEIPPLSDAVIAAQEQANANTEARAYLASTDWMLLRELDGGKAMSTETKTARAAARAEVTS